MRPQVSFTHQAGNIFSFKKHRPASLAFTIAPFLPAYPIREILIRVAGVRGFWGYYLPLAITMSTSADYELIEWGAARLFGGELGTAYLGTQGDVWDAQKDMALAGLGVPRRASSSLAVFVVTILPKAVLVKWKFM